MTFDVSGDKLSMNSFYTELLPKTSSFLPPLETATPINALKFGCNPEKVFGYIRDGHPIGSSSPKPKYRYYGMEIEIANEAKNLNSLHVTGFHAPNIVKYGFLYGTDGSIGNGLEFRSAPQGFETLSKNLVGFFNVLDTPLASDYSPIHKSTTITTTDESRYAPIAGSDLFWDRYEGNWINKEDIPQESLPNATKSPKIIEKPWKTTPKCGLHIHVSRDALTELQIGKILAFVYSGKNNAFMTHIAGRTSAQYAEMTSCPPFEIDSKGVIKPRRSEYTGLIKETRVLTDPKTGKVLKTYEVPKYHKGDNKYTAVNLRHKQTIEFRIFKGVDTAKEAITKLQFVDSLMEYTSCSSRSTASLSDCLSHEKYVAWLLSDPFITKRYSLLIDYIKEFSIKGSSSISKAISDNKSYASSIRKQEDVKVYMSVFGK